MAWSSQAQRYGLGYVPFPAGLDQQERFSLGNAVQPQVQSIGGLNPTLDSFVVDFDGTFAAAAGYSWSTADRYGVALVPYPGAGFNFTTRQTIGYVPGVGTPSTDVDGDIVITLSEFVVDFDGTVVNPATARDGFVQPQIDAFVTSLAGEAYYNLFFEAEFSITPTWVITELPQRAGDIDVTIGGFTVDFDGFVLPPDGTQGQVSVALSEFTADFDGTFTDPPGVDGNVQLDIEVFATSFIGSSVAPGGVVGFIQPVIDGFTVGFAGDFTPWQTDGATNFTLGDFGVGFEGAFIDSSANSGRVDIVSESFSVAISGTFVRSTQYDVETTCVFQEDAETRANFQADAVIRGLF